MTFSGSRTELENLTLVSNAETGATILQGEVRDSRAERNGSNGFWFFSAGSVLGSRLNSLFNGGHGFALRGETRLVDCVAANNDGDGFGQSPFPVGANLITGCVATNNGGNGLSLAASDGYGSCSIDGNGGSAVTGGLKVSPSTCGAVLCP